MSWGSFPQSFIDDEGLVRLMQSAGKHRLGALKIYLALTVLVDFQARSVAVGVRRLQDVTGMSKPLVLRSIVELERAGILVVDRSAYRSTYTLHDRGSEDKQFAKVPKGKILNGLAKLPNRGVSGDAALALYLILLARRSKNSFKTIGISHERLRALSAIRNEHVRAGLDVLFNHLLIHIGQAEARGAKGHPMNEYTLIGNFDDRIRDQPSGVAEVPF